MTTTISRRECLTLARLTRAGSAGVVCPSGLRQGQAAARGRLSTYR
jgi:hypothetical protein